MSTRTYAVATAPSVRGRWSQLEPLTWDTLVDSLPGLPCYVGGTVAGTVRNKETVTTRSVLTLDEDAPAPDWTARVAAALAGTAHATHETKRSTPEGRRYRLLAPLSRDVTPEEYWIVAEAVMNAVGWGEDDREGRQHERLMHGSDGREVAVVGGEPLDVDAWLARALTADVAPRVDPDARRRAHDPCGCDAAATLHPWAAAAVKGELGRLDELAAEVWAPGSHWDDITFQVACNLREIANTPCCGYPLPDAEADLMGHAPTDDQWGARENAAKWRSAEATIGDGQRRCMRGGEFEPVPRGEPTPAGGAGGAGGGGGPKEPPLAVRLRRHVEQHHDVFTGSEDGRVFAVPRAGGRAEPLSAGYVMRAAPHIGRQSATLSAAATEAAKVLAADADGRPPRELALRSHHQPGRVVIDLAQPGTGRCAVVTADGWTVEDAPPPGLTFKTAGRPLPDPERGGDVDELRRVLRWDAGDPRWALVRGWLACAPLDLVARPLLGLFGPQGSAKSTTGRFVAGVLDPKPRGVLGSSFGKNLADDQTKALATYLVSYDNVSRVSGDTSDWLARVVTGDLVEKRKLYTDSDLLSISYRRTGVMTAISLPLGIKPDALDRLVCVRLDRPAERASEAELEVEWAAAHPRVLAGVLDMVSAVLAGQGANPEGLRMADYAGALWALDPELYRAYADNVSEARSDVASDDDFVATLRRWLEEEGGEWEGTAAAAHGAAGVYRPARDPGERSFWPDSPRSFSGALGAADELLRAIGIEVVDRRSNGQRLKRFTLRPPAPRLSAADRELL